jgi:hypothetical protein
VFLFFSVARSASTGQAERATEASDVKQRRAEPIQVPAEASETLPTDILVDVSPLALRMSSPFNASYWLSAA